MLVEKDIVESYDKQIKVANVDQISILDKEVKTLCTWATRWKKEVEDVPCRMIKTSLLIEQDNEIVEVSASLLSWDLESVNLSLLKHLDEQIVGSYMVLKKAKVNRPSSFLYMHFLKNVYVIGDAQKYDNEQWRSAILVLKRLRSTCRIAFRFDNEKYHKSVVCNEDGSTSILYTKDRWQAELVARKILKRKG